MNLYQAHAVFNAQYLGKNVLSHFEAPNLATTLSSDYLFNSDKEWFLLLRTVDMLTDEEKETIAKIENLLFTTNVKRDRFKEYIHNNIHFLIHKTPVSQYLLRIGILLPFIYLNDLNQPETLTPTQLVEMGWAKIKTS